MTKAELLAQIAEETETSKVRVEKILETIIETIVNEVKADRSLTLKGLGTFSLAKRAARKGRNPKTGAEIDIAASKSMKFKPSKTVKDVLN
ncbi:MAG: HU family DNA-binding protein [Thermodesulfobacteriota bacterium]|nr:HU family DNA-binding protein [Thermodesulfobacteriota bacterium]